MIFVFQVWVCVARYIVNQLQVIGEDVKRGYENKIPSCVLACFSSFSPSLK